MESLTIQVEEFFYSQNNLIAVMISEEFVTATMNRQSILEKGRLEDAFKMFDKVMI